MKRFTAMLCAAAMMLGLTACGGKDKEVTIDPAKLASELLTTVTSDSLTETASDMLPSIYFLKENGEIQLVKKFGYEDFKGRLS